MLWRGSTPSTYHEHVAQRRDPLRLSARARRDLALKPEIARVFAENFALGRKRRQQLRQRHGRDINSLYKAKVIHRRGPWRSFEAVEYATLEWVDWFNNRRLLEPIGNIPPAEAEERYYATLDEARMEA